MMKKRLSMSFVVAILVICFIYSLAAAETITWKMTSTWTAGNQLIEMDRNFVKMVDKLTGKEFKIKFFDGNTLIPILQVFDAVSDGTIDASGDAAAYWAGKNTAFSPLCQHPFGLTGIDAMVWIYQGGGFDLYQEVYGKFGMVYLPYAVSPMESGVRGNKPIRKFEDYKGLKIRMSGQMAGMLLRELGAVQVNLTVPETYQALEKGVVDALELAWPGFDAIAGIDEVCKYWSTPGWHAPGSVYGIMINKKSWDSIPDHTKTMLKTCAKANMIFSFGLFQYTSIAGTQKFIDKGTTITRLSKEDLKKLERIANKYTLAMCKANPLFAKVIYSQQKYLNDMTKLRETQQPFTYGRNPSSYLDLNKIKACIK